MSDFKVGQVVYEKTFGARGVVLGDDEGWPSIRWQDGSEGACRPSLLVTDMPEDVAQYRAMVASLGKSVIIQSPALTAATQQKGRTDGVVRYEIKP